ncbi:putative toxin-antitoxin system toxin component [Nocardia asteroides NBRC 15531]|uniref:Endoribonuclease YoeB n=1 Tax=Nocardia asteroides NBRC 15531 TaxID=1110697 RepID=U5E999_NOCAS|nr:putative toxin-antitoxin system toxin component [Nocardia asteroides NBRC 15531]SFL87716.1 toxin YoeB [Nocardia asteroides]VEG38178.1 Toxin RelK [Nocardia asteroides]
MKVVFAKVGFEDLGHWTATDRKIALRVLRLIDDIDRDPFSGLGKPEPEGRQVRLLVSAHQ